MLMQLKRFKISYLGFFNSGIIFKIISLQRKNIWHLPFQDMKVMEWWINASFAVHENFRLHCSLLGKFWEGSSCLVSLKQKINTRYYTESELVVVGNFVAMIYWTSNILEAQGCRVLKNILYQEKKCAILLERNGRKSVVREFGT